MENLAEVRAAAPRAIGETWSWKRDRAAAYIAGLSPLKSTTEIEAFMSTYVCVEAVGVDLLATVSILYE